MTERLDLLIDRIPKAPPMRADVAARFATLPAHEIERQGLDELAQWLWITCELFFGLHPSNERIVSNVLANDAFALSIAYLAQLSYADAERQACLDVIEDLLVDVATDPERKAIEVEPALMSAFILAFALRNVRDRNRPLDGLESRVVRRDALYRSLDKDAGLTDVLYAVRQRFAPRARVV